MKCFPPLIIVLLLPASVARAQFTTPSDPLFPLQWTRPANDGAASAGHTTYQQWEVFSSTTGPNVPDVVEINPNGTANAFDSAAPGSLSFVSSSGNIYSPDGVIEPRATVPGYALASATVDVLLQVRSQGQEIDTADVKIGGLSISSLPNYSYHRLHELFLGEGQFGGSRVDHAWTFTVPADAALFQIDWGWNITSSSLDRLAIDTRATVSSGLTGDLDDDGDIDSHDIDTLWNVIRPELAGSDDPGGNDNEDLNSDGFVNEKDVDTMLRNLLTAGTGRAYGDADLDGGVGGLDYTAWRVRAGTGWANGDFDGDGGVGGLDYTLWRTRPTAYPGTVGPHGSGPQAVPEPASCVLLLVGAGALLVRGGLVRGRRVCGRGGR